MATEKTVRCGDCQRELPETTHFTEINPEGGYGLPRLLVCDDCMRSGRWHDWKVEHWPNWPEAHDSKGRAMTDPTISPHATPRLPDEALIKQLSDLSRAEHDDLSIAAEAAARLSALCAEIEELKENVHLANGVADLAMKHRDIAERKLDAALAENERLPELMGDEMTEQRISAPAPEWRGRHLWIGRLWVGQVLHWTNAPKPWWRAWAMVDQEDGTEVGRCDTEDEAKAAVLAAVISATEQN